MGHRLSPSPQPSPARGEGQGWPAETASLLPLREKDRMRGWDLSRIYLFHVSVSYRNNEANLENARPSSSWYGFLHMRILVRVWQTRAKRRQRHRWQILR